MDPITHGAIGAAISSYSGTGVSLDNPVTIGAVIGAMIPDIDVVTRFFYDDLVYIRHHRGMTHSIPFLLGFSIIITAGLYLFFPEMNIFQTWLFTFLGAMSHTLFDTLNSYGAKVLRKKWKASLLTLYDPIIAVMTLLLIFSARMNLLSYWMIAVGFFVYLYLRLRMKRNAKEHILNHYAEKYSVEKITLMPALKVFYKWDYIVYTDRSIIVGAYNPFGNEYKEVVRKKREACHIMPTFLKTKAGRYFAEFSPDLHIERIDHHEHNAYRITDLRYHFKDEFMHHATMTIDDDNNIIKTYIQPYDLNRMILVEAA